MIAQVRNSSSFFQMFWTQRLSIQKSPWMEVNDLYILMEKAFILTSATS